jgi:hypothetical protein
MIVADYELAVFNLRDAQFKEINMANGQERGNREAKKPKKEKVKVIAAAPSRKVTSWQPTLDIGKKK